MSHSLKKIIILFILMICTTIKSYWYRFVKFSSRNLSYFHEHNFMWSHFRDSSYTVLQLAGKNACTSYCIGVPNRIILVVWRQNITYQKMSYLTEGTATALQTEVKNQQADNIDVLWSEFTCMTTQWTHSSIEMLRSIITVIANSTCLTACFN